MGREARRNAEKRQAREELPWRVLKAVTGALLAIPCLIIMAAVYCYRGNRWVWSGLSD